LTGDLVEMLARKESVPGRPRTTPPHRDV
jgi:hypothetical protein